MPVLGLGLTVSGLGFLAVSWESWSAGFPVEVALLRGLIAFMAINFVAYVGELIVATAPPRPPRAEPEAVAPEEPVALRAPAGRDAAPAIESGREPVPLRPELQERQAA
jgi:hypothetical protein